MSTDKTSAGDLRKREAEPDGAASVPPAFAPVTAVVLLAAGLLLSPFLPASQYRVEAQVTLAEDPERDVLVTLRGRVQPRFQLELRDELEDRSSFFMRRVRLDVRGHVLTESLTFRIYPALERSANLRDGWINYAFSPEAELRFGQYTVPFQWHRFISSTRLHFAERALASATFGFPSGRDIGLMLHGRLEDRGLGYAVGIFDGAGRNVRESDSSGNMVSARVVHAVLGEIPRDETDFRRSPEPDLAVGLAGQSAWRNAARDWSLGRSPTGVARGDWVTGTAFAHLSWQGVSLTADGYLRHVSPEAPTVEGYDGWAFMVTGGYAVLPERLEAVARVSRVKLDRDDPTTRETEWGLGVNVYQRGHLAKTRVQWLARRNTGPTGPEVDHTLLVEQHLMF